MESSSIIETVRQKFELLRPVMTERMRRHWAASEALALPRGGITMFAAATGLSPTPITAAMPAFPTGSHPDRQATSQFSNARVEAFRQRRQAVGCVDHKKKENLGDFKNGGDEWQPAGQPEQVRAKDFPDKRLGKAIPYGVYDPALSR